MVATGLLDVRLLTAVPSQPYLRLTAAAAASWEAVADEVQRRYGWRPALTDAYRDYAAQVRLFRERYTTTPLPGRPTKVWGGIVYYLRPGMATAAVPGTSNHGRADTVDVRDMASFVLTRFRQFSDVATEHGWSNKEGAKIGEPWHWQRVADLTPIPAEQEDDDVLTPEQVAQLARADENAFETRKYLGVLAEQIATVRAELGEVRENAAETRKFLGPMLAQILDDPDVQVDAAAIAAEVARLLPDYEVTIARKAV